MDTTKDCKWLHETLESLPLLTFPYEEDSLPDNGIYFFYEKGECSGHSKDNLRVVRVGTAKDGNFKSRISEHFRPEGIKLSKDKPSPKDRSIFRKNLGRAFLNIKCPDYLPVWEIDFMKSENLRKSAGKRDIDLEQQIEEETTKHLRGKFAFRFIEVPSQKARMGKDGLESRLIGTLSHCSLCVPSKQWLGKSSPKIAIQESGLWLVQHLKCSGITAHDKDVILRGAKNLNKTSKTFPISNNSGRIYFVGGGPGDPGLMTVRGMELLKAASLVLAPGHYKDSYAAELHGKEFFDPFDLHFKELTERIDATLKDGREVVFLVPGDLAMFSPVQSIISRYPEAEVVPGVSALNAASAALRKTFDLPGVSHSTIATSPKTITGSPDTISELSRHRSTLVLFMNNKKPDELASELSAGYPPDTPVAVVSNISLPGQAIINTTVGALSKDVEPAWFADEDAFKIVVVGKVLCASEDPSWWDRRKDMRDERHRKKRNAK